jgi:glycosyltransferase involved in cell wall biosynthesis
VVPPEEPAALAGALNELLADDTERERLGQGALALAEGPSSWVEIGRRTVDLYRRLLG